MFVTIVLCTIAMGNTQMPHQETAHRPEDTRQNAAPRTLPGYPTSQSHSICSFGFLRVYCCQLQMQSVLTHRRLTHSLAYPAPHTASTNQSVPALIMNRELPCRVCFDQNSADERHQLWRGIRRHSSQGLITTTAVLTLSTAPGTSY